MNTSAAFRSDDGRLRAPQSRCAPARLLATCVLVSVLMTVDSPQARAQSAPQRAAARYEVGRTLFLEGNKESALAEFQLANELDPQIEYLYNIAQCEYHLGKVGAARDHYQRVLDTEKTGPIAEQSRLRIEAIDKRPSAFVINSLPAGVEIAIEGGGQTFTGQAPNTFDLPRGRYRLTAKKANYVTQTQVEDIGVAQTKSLLFQLVPIKARLEIRTRPAGAALFVRGNRAQVPYRQDVDPGAYEIYSEATDYLPRRETLHLGPGQTVVVDFPLAYVQRSGRPELVGFWGAIGAVAAGGAVLARLQNPMTKASTPASLSLVGAAAAVGGIGGALISRAFVPDYTRDNVALFRIGAGWIGATEGASLGLALSTDLPAAWLGGAAGVGLGTLAGRLLESRAPNYGRVAIIQSAAAMGALAGALAVPALHFDPDVHTSRGVFLGLNVGLAAGLAFAYLPDQRLYGPSWKRVIVVDLTAVAGAFAGALTGTVDTCISTPSSRCTLQANSRTAKLALLGGAVGLVSGWLLTRSFDKNDAEPSVIAPISFVPAPSALAVPKGDGAFAMIPGLATRGRF